MKFIVQDPFSIKKVLIFGGFGLCRFQHKVGMNSFPMRMNVFSYGTNSFPWGMYSFRSKIPIVTMHLLSRRLWHVNDICRTLNIFLETSNCTPMHVTVML